MRTFLTLLVLTLLVAVCPVGADHHNEPSFDLLSILGDADSGGEGRVHEDRELQSAIQSRNQTLMRGAALSYNGSEDMVYIKLNADYVLRLNQATRRNLWRDYLVKKFGSNDVVIAYSQNGRQEYRMLYDEEFQSGEGMEALFNGSVVWGYVYDAADYPALSANLLKTLNDENAPDPLSVSGNEPVIILPEKEAKAIALMATVRNQNPILIVSMKNLNVELKAWAKSAMEAAFIQRGAPDLNQSLNLPALAGDLKTNLENASADVEDMLVEVQSTADAGSSAIFSGQSGSFLEYRKQIVGSDQYRFQEAAVRPLEKLLEVISSEEASFVALRALYPGLNSKLKTLKSATNTLVREVKARSFQSMDNSPVQKIQRVMESVQALNQEIPRAQRRYEKALQATQRSFGAIEYAQQF